MCFPPTSGSRTTTASPIRIPASWTMWPIRRPTWCACICPRMPTACSPASTTASAASNYVNVHGHFQASPPPVADHGAGHHATAPRASASGTGPATTRAQEPDIVMACCGDTPTLETLAAVTILRDAHAGAASIRVVNVVDLMQACSPKHEHPHGLSLTRITTLLFTKDKPIHLRFPRLSQADSRTDLPPPQSEAACARLQGGGHHYHPL